MNRTYTVAQAGDVIRELYDAVPEICIGADIMVGFPGETDDSFQRMYDWLESMPFAYFHVFSYSKRDQTRAARMSEQVPRAIDRERSQRLRSLSDQKSATFNGCFKGEILPVLVEDQLVDQLMRGRTDHGIKVCFEGQLKQVNTFVDVEVISSDVEGAMGRLTVPVTVREMD